MACPACGDTCDTRECGHACGTACGDMNGACPAGEACEEGQCVADCVPDCSARACGADPACPRYSCGACAPGERCEANQCLSDCGPIPLEGCCEDGAMQRCVDGQITELDCEHAGLPLLDQSCGWLGLPGNGAYGCGGIGVDPSGTEALCPVCVPQCLNKACGPDGCGGHCGMCQSGSACAGGLCLPLAP